MVLVSYRPANSCWRLLTSGEMTLAPPDCLLRLLRDTPRQRVCTLFIIGFKFTFFVSVMVYWHVVGEPGGQGQLSNLPVDVPCPHMVLLPCSVLPMYPGCPVTAFISLDCKFFL